MLDGDVAVDTLVSQGATAIGEELTVTAADGDGWVTELDGVDVVTAMQTRARLDATALPPGSRLFVGLQVDGASAIAPSVDACPPEGSQSLSCARSSRSRLNAAWRSRYLS